MAGYSIPIPKNADRETRIAIQQLLEYINQLRARLDRLERERGAS